MQETKIAQAKFAPRAYRGYTIRVSPSSGKNCGGVGLVYRKSKRFSVENAKVVGPNVISFEMVLHKLEQWFVVGCYFPPSDKGGEAQRLALSALKNAPSGTHLLLIGDLNADLEYPRDIQEEVLSSELEERGMRCATWNFLSRRTRRNRGRWTWRQRRTNKEGERYWLRSKPDYFMMQERDRARVRRCRWILPRHHDSDHRALVAKIYSRKGGGP